MVHRIEKQPEVNVIITENIENTAMFAKSSQYGATGRGYIRGKLVNTKGNARDPGEFSSRGNGGRLDSKKSFQYCDYCHNTGHEGETCFRLHRYLEWFKVYKACTYAANMAETPLRVESITRTSNDRYQEPTTPNTSAISITDAAAHFAQLEQFAGKISAPFQFAFTTRNQVDIGT